MRVIGIQGGIHAGVIASMVMANLLVGTSSTAAADNSQCTTAALQSKAPAGTTISSATIVPAAAKLPEHCAVKGSVATPGNSVDFQLALPNNWNGKFLFQGVGGFAGSMGRLDAGLERGYAAATTDTGHQGSSATDASWALNNRPKEIDYGHRGTHVTAVAAKSLTAAYFGSAPRYAYFNGCSNGGRQALMEAQRYPEDFNGISAGDPSFGAMGYVRRALTYQFMLASPERILPPAKLEVLSKAVLAVCDKNDGVADGLIGDPRMCKFDPTPLQCNSDAGDDCLTAGQLQMVKQIYGESKTPQGERLYGFPVGHEAGATGWPLWITGKVAPAQQPDGTLNFGAESPTGYRFADGFMRYMAFEQDDPGYDWRHFDVSHDLPKIRTIAEILSPTSPDLKELQRHGSKLLLYHGWSDPAISAYGTIDYYDKVVKTAGGKQQADDFVRLFLVPGMHHCAGGPGPNSFDTLTALEQWVEKGTPPQRIVASHSTDGKVDRTRPLCPEPEVARYVGNGSIDAAESFKCDVPR